MKSDRSFLVVAFFATVIGFAAQAQTLYNGVGHIPAAYQERWNRAGLLQDMSKEFRALMKRAFEAERSASFARRGGASENNAAI